jgi:membrane protease YdiL (CAAX protease family)
MAKEQGSRDKGQGSTDDLIRPKSKIQNPKSIDPVLAGGLAAAYAAFALTFRGPRKRFWQRMTMTGLALGSLALFAQPELRRVRPRPMDVARDVGLGLGSAGALYVIFQVGDRLARVILPGGSSDIESIYELNTLRPKKEIAARLAIIVGPAEELFWRGMVQERLSLRYGKVPGAILGTAAYGGAHLVTGNITLIGAATVAGAFWGGLAAAGVPMGALIISHMAWDIWIFLIAPTQPEK